MMIPNEQSSIAYYPQTLRWKMTLQGRCSSFSLALFSFFPDRLMLVELDLINTPFLPRKKFIAGCIRQTRRQISVFSSSHISWRPDSVEFFLIFHHNRVATVRRFRSGHGVSWLCNQSPHFCDYNDFCLYL